MSTDTSKPKTLLIIEHAPVSLANFSAIAQQAARANIAMRVIVPYTAAVHAWANAPFAIHQTNNWTTSGLNAAVHNIEATADVVGIGTLTGLFTPYGLLAAQVAELCQQRDLPFTPIEALYRTHNKYLMRQTLHNAQVYTVRFARVTDQASLQSAAKSVGFPLTLKPVVASYSSFMSRCENLQDMQRVYKHYRQHVQKDVHATLFCPHVVEAERFERWHEMLAEEAIDGYELSVEALCTEHHVLPLIIHDKLEAEQTDHDSFQNLLITPPTRVDAYQQQEILAYTRTVLSTLGVQNCFCHVKLRYDARGRASVIEVRPRIGGMRIKDSLRTLRGICYEHIYVEQLLGNPITLPYLAEPTGYYAMLGIHPRKSGTLTAIHGTEAARQLPGMLDVGTHIVPGTAVNGDAEQVFAVDAWFQADTPEGIIALDRKVKSLVSIHVD